MRNHLAQSFRATICGTCFCCMSGLKTFSGSRSKPAVSFAFPGPDAKAIGLKRASCSLEVDQAITPLKSRALLKAFASSHSIKFCSRRFSVLLSASPKSNGQRHVIASASTLWMSSLLGSSSRGQPG